MKIVVEPNPIFATLHQPAPRLICFKVILSQSIMITAFRFVAPNYSEYYLQETVGEVFQQIRFLVNPFQQSMVADL